MVVRLEPLAREHLDAFAPMTVDPDVLHFTGFPDPPREDFVETWFARYEAGRADGTKEVFAVLPADGDELLGVVMAVTIDRTAAETELGYLVGAAARGRGVATAAVAALTRWALEDQGLERLTLMIEDDNIASRVVAERCGYVLEGFRRNTYFKGRRTNTAVYSRIPSDR